MEKLLVPPAADSGSAFPWHRWVRFVSLAAVVVSLIALARLLPENRLSALVTAKVAALGAWGPVAFGGAYVLAVLLFVPGWALTAAAGAVFGLAWGTATVSAASTTAAAVSFLIGRYLARDPVRRWTGKSPRFAAMDRAIGEGGWKIIALLRLSPAVPFSLGNYLFGLTSIRFIPYVLTSWVFMLPGTVMYVYLGHAGRAGLTAAAGGGIARSAGQWTLLVIGLAATVAVTFCMTRLALRARRDHAVLDDAASGTLHPTGSGAAPRPGMGGTLLVAAVGVVLTGCTVFAYAKRSVVDALFGPPQVKGTEKFEEKKDGPTFDHSPLDALLRKYVDDAGFVDYKGLEGDAGQLDAYVASLTKAPTARMGRNERLALLINAYNAFTLRLILDHYPIKSIKEIPAAERWDARRWNVGGQILSLNQIEHEQIRPNFKEPRIHFALVCAAVGCPPLRNEAYTAGRMEDQLDAQARYVHSHDRWFRFDPQAKRAEITSLYDWYGGDFEQAAGSALNFAARYSPPLKAAQGAGRKPDVQFLDYDWSLNGKENRK